VPAALIPRLNARESDRLLRVTRIVVTVLALVAALAAPVAAEHEIYYRYTVLGYVRDAAGRPLAAQAVDVVRDKTGFAYRDATDKRGFFVLVVRLGDESAGEGLTLRTGRITAHLFARFDARNHTEERGTRVDVDGARVIERSAAFRSTLAAYVGATSR